MITQPANRLWIVHAYFHESTNHPSFVSKIPLHVHRLYAKSIVASHFAGLAFPLWFCHFAESIAFLQGSFGYLGRNEAKLRVLKLRKWLSAYISHDIPTIRVGKAVWLFVISYISISCVCVEVGWNICIQHLENNNTNLSRMYLLIPL